MNARDNAQDSAVQAHGATIMKLKMNFIFKIGIYSLIWRSRPVKERNSQRTELTALGQIADNPPILQHAAAC